MYFGNKPVYNKKSQKIHKQKTRWILRPDQKVGIKKIKVPDSTVQHIPASV